MIDELTQTALVGTGQSTSPPFRTDDAFEELSSRISEESPERLLMLRAGFQAVAARAGFEPVSLTEMMTAPTEVLKSPSENLARLLTQIFDPQRFKLLPGFLKTMSAAQVHIPHRLIPYFLDLQGIKSRSLLIPVLSERAKWIAKYHSEWDWCLSAMTGDRLLQKLIDDWNEAPINGRVEALKQMRQRDRNLADQWLAETLPREKADYRKKFVEAMAVDLKESDTEILEPLRKDRSKDVRELAYQLLIELPDSVVSCEIQELGVQVFFAADQEQHQDLAASRTLNIDVQKVYESSSDFVSLHSRSLKHQEIQLLAAALPPSFWLHHSQLGIHDFLKSLRNIRSSEQVLIGITQAAVRFFHRDPMSRDFLKILMPLLVESHFLTRTDRSDSRQALKTIFETLPEDLISDFLVHFLELASQPRWTEIIGTVTDFPDEWTLKFSRDFLTATRKVFLERNDQGLLKWSEVLQHVAIQIHTDALPDALGAWNINTDFHAKPTATILVQNLRHFGDIVKSRIEFRDEVTHIVQNPLSSDMTKP